VHGVLHLLGYDHDIPADATIMFEKQEAILRLIKDSSATVSPTDVNELEV
ncbi:MAG: rRNA maturation RNAse YbeY, partial [Candidatus Poribacteria bacterium]|nr:rRNA maturation RNAse YbeY [Candidatus Poribacteria bacterium]